MTPKQQKFADAYLTCLNATEAAKLAGYSKKTAYSIGWENLRKPEIADYISKRFQESAMSADENLMHIAEIARGVYGPGFFLNETTETVKGENGDEVQIRRIQVDWNRVKEYGRLIKSLTFTNFGPRIELHDRVRNLELIGKHHGLFDRGSEDKPLTVNNINYTVGEWQTEQARRRAEVEATKTVFDDDTQD